MGYFDLTGQTAIITGSATGIGESIARRLAKAGATVVVADLNLAGATEVAQSIGGTAFAVELDVTSAASAEQAVADVLARTGRLDIVVNNAGIGGKAAPIWEQSLEDWNRAIAINMTGVFNLT